MKPRELIEQRELQTLSARATKSINTQGRAKPVALCDLRTEFQKDRDRITHSKAFRRLMHKTQVFISPEGDHYRTRLTHTLEVAQISRTISRALLLNEDLTEAIALGHDMGHTPFGHTGEDALDKLLPEGFHHNEQSVRVVTFLENAGEGLNLTFEVIDGILNHRTRCTPSTPEGRVVQLSDKIAYMNHDVDDAIRAKLLKASDLPDFVGTMLGQNSSKRIDFLVRNLVQYSMNRDEIALEPHIAESMNKLRTYLFDHVYANQLHQKERAKIQTMFRLLYEYFLDAPQHLPAEFIPRMAIEPEKTVADYIAGMTDRFAMKKFNEIFMPSAWEA